MSDTRSKLEEKTDYLGTENIWRLLAKFGLPAMATMLINCTYNLVDRIFIGWGVGYEAIAAITSSSPIVNMMQALGVWIGLGASIIFAVKLGAGDTQESERLLGNAFSSITILSVLVMAFGFFFAAPMLNLIGVDADVMDASLKYLRIVLFGAFFYMIGCGMIYFVRNEGSPAKAMIFSSAGAVLNTILDPLFIFAFKWGIAGAAWATVLGQILSAVLIILHYTDKRKGVMHLRLRSLVPNLRMTLESMKYGLSSFISTAMSSVTHAVLLSSINKYGALAGEGIATIAVSCAGIVTSIGGFIIMPVIGIQQAAQTIIGYNYGAAKYRRVKSATRCSNIASLIYLTVGFVIIMVWAEKLVLIYGIGDDAQLLYYAGRCMRLYHYFMIMMPFSVIVSAHFQAVEKPYKALFLSLSRQLLGIVPAAYILPLFFGVDGALAATSVGDAISGIIGIVMLAFEYRRLSRLENERLPAAQP